MSIYTHPNTFMAQYKKLVCTILLAKAIEEKTWLSP